MENTFKFALRQMVKITDSGEQGQIIGRGEFTEGASTYYIRYKAADGRAVQAWWTEETLTAL